MSQESSAPGVLLTTDTVRQWVAERDRLTAALADIEKRLQALKLIVGVEAQALIGEPVPVPPAPRFTPYVAMDARPSWARFVEETLVKAERGLTNQELMAEARETDLAESLNRNPNGFYNTVSRLAGGNRVIRHGDLVYAPSVYERVRRGELDDPRFKEQQDKGPGFTAGILEALWRAHRGLDAAGVRQELEKNEGHAEKMRRNPQYLYTALSRLVKQGSVVREDGLYWLASKRTGPSEAQAQDGPETGGAGPVQRSTPSLFNP